MNDILINLFKDFISGCDEYITGFLKDTLDWSLFIEKKIHSTMAINVDISAVFNVVFTFGISLLVLLFLKKGFETYFAWSSGDPDRNPVQLVVSFVKALIIAISFPLLYRILSGITVDLTEQILNGIAISVNEDNITIIIIDIIASTLSSAIAGVVMIILYIILYIQLTVRGLEILVLRIRNANSLHRTFKYRWWSIWNICKKVYTKCFYSTSTSSFNKTINRAFNE